MSKLYEDFIEEYSEYLIQTNDALSKLGNDKYEKNEISSVTRMLMNQATLTTKTQELLLVMLTMVNRICDVLEVRNDKEHDQTP
jgi:hypothetical protein